jgi:hypothetical protein
MRRIALAGVLLVCGLESVGWAQGRRVDTVFLTGRADRIATAAGGEAGVQWLRSVSEKSGFQIGGAGGSIANNWWVSGRAGGHRRWRALTASGAVDLGKAGDISRHFTYGGYEAGIATPVLPILLFEIKAQHLTLPERASQTVYGSTVSWAARRFLMLQAGYHELFARNGRSGIVSGRADVTTGRIVWIAGAVRGPAGHSDPLQRQLALTPGSREWFGGSKFAVGRYEMSSIFDLTQSAVRVSRVLVNVKIR